ncbi:hypothetical protein Scep_002652 [Stephania cephalantha]|uniref:Uncharacterized protein n=1 Tax=Stephania cephalantha TaxID=152367 RepID=A0AAP0LAL7_9MAGN
MMLGLTHKSNYFDQYVEGKSKTLYDDFNLADASWKKKRNSKFSYPPPSIGKSSRDSGIKADQGNASQGNDRNDYSSSANSLSHNLASSALHQQKLWCDLEDIQDDHLMLDVPLTMCLEGKKVENSGGCSNSTSNSKFEFGRGTEGVIRPKELIF